MTQLHQPLEKNEIVINSVRIRIPPKVNQSVAEYAMELVLHVARYYGIVGEQEGTKAKGFLIVSLANTPVAQNGKETLKIDLMTISKEGKGLKNRTEHDG